MSVDVQITGKLFAVNEGRFYIILINRFAMSHASNEIIISQMDVEDMTRCFWQ